jgi:hypothetical protein
MDLFGPALGKVTARIENGGEKLGYGSGSELLLRAA